ncbi:hypothetical protein, partial [Paenibacillus sp. TY11]|uniref:hypothetical protein n=1 Tax=Paenibacillus sp. TY11 TaxID=3448633 RepID=UPI00403A73C0
CAGCLGMGCRRSYHGSGGEPAGRSRRRRGVRDRPRTLEVDHGGRACGGAQAWTPAGSRAPQAARTGVAGAIRLTVRSSTAIL